MSACVLRYRRGLACRALAAHCTPHAPHTPHALASRTHSQGPVSTNLRTYMYSRIKTDLHCRTYVQSSHPLKLRTCTCPSRGQSSEAIIYGVTQIAFVSSTVPEREVASR
eukprot:5719348-Prymnesium_polylepis.1